MGILKVNLRGGFSDRHDIKKINTTIQLDKLDERTRIAIVNRINSLYNNYFGKDIIITDYRGREFWHDILSNVYLQVVDFNSVYNSSALLNIIKSTILEDEYDDVLTLVEYFINELIKLYPKTRLNLVGVEREKGYFSKIINAIESKNLGDWVNVCDGSKGVEEFPSKSTF